MNRGATAAVIVVLCVWTYPIRGDAETSDAGSDSVLGVFEGRTPCGSIANEFTGFPVQNCEKIKWRLTLYRDDATGAPTDFFYEGTRTERRGRWRIDRSSRVNRSWTIYRLDSGNDAQTLSLLSVDNAVLLLLDRADKVLVGDASWSYALNRIR